MSIDNAPRYDSPILPSANGQLNPAYWDTVRKLQDEGKKKETLLAVLDYIEPGLSKKSTDSTQNKFSIPHGSIEVNIEFNEAADKYSVQTPFLKLPAAPSVAMLRQVAEMNFSSLCLAQVYLRGDALHFEYNSTITGADPYKFYYTIEEICREADNNDDVFVEKFKAGRLAELRAQPLNAAQLEKSLAAWKSILEEGIALSEYFGGKNVDGLSWESVLLALCKMEYVVKPQGFMQTEVNRIIAELYGDKPLKERTQKARASLDKLLKTDSGKIKESLYIPHTLIPSKKRMALAGVQDFLKGNFETARNEMSSGDFSGVVYSALVAFYRLNFYYIYPDDVHQILDEALAVASGKNWKDAANELFTRFDKLMKIEVKAEA